jgi:pimeloyl-ACP methyl ester carboxylesterase
VVLYDPFGEEKKSAFRVMVRLARACADHGLAAWRFDLSGTGESGGEPGAASWEDWCEEAAAVAAWVRQQVPGGLWIAVGVRLGALLAVQAAVHGGAAAVSLVEPVLSGEDCLRDLDRRQRIKQAVGGSGSEAADSQSRWARGETVDFGGFEVGPRLAAGLRPALLSAALAQLPPSCPLQVLRVSGSPSFPPAWKTLTERAAAAPPGRAMVLRDKPFWGQLEYYESALVLDEVLAFVEALSAAGQALPAGEDS